MSLGYRLVATVTFLTVACFAQNIVLPDPNRAATNALSGQIAFPGAPSANLSGLPGPEFARSMADRVVAELDRLADAIVKGVADAASLAQKLGDLQRQKDAAELEKARIMDEYRHGYFCSKCHKSKTELGGEAAFQQHVIDVGGKVVPATPEEIRAKEQEFDGKLSNLDSQIRSASQERQRKLQETQSERDYAGGATSLWNAASQLEPVLLRAQEDAAEQKEQADMRQVQNQLARMGNAPGDTARNTLVQVGQRLISESKTRYARYQSEMAAAQENQGRQNARISSAVSRSGGNNPYSPNSVAIAGNNFRFGAPFPGGAPGPDEEVRKLYSALESARYKAGTPTGPLADRTFTTSSDSTPKPKVELPKPPAPVAAPRPVTSSTPAAPPKTASSAPSTTQPSHTALPLPPQPPPASQPESSSPYPVPGPFLTSSSTPDSGSRCTGVAVDQAFQRWAASLGDKCTCWGEGNYSANSFGSDRLYLDASAIATVVNAKGDPAGDGGDLQVKNLSSKSHFYFGLSSVVNMAVAPGRTETFPLSIYKTIGRYEPTVVDLRARYCKE